MNNTTRSLIFFSGLFIIIFYYFSIIPLLPMAFTNEYLYTNYLTFSVIGLFPIVQMGMRKFVLKKYKLGDESLFHLPVHDAKQIHRITFYAIAFLIIMLPITGNKFNFGALKPVHYLIFVGWIAFSELLIFVTYKTTRAYFGKSYILISGIDFRPDFPLGSMLYSHSGVYFYEDFKYYYTEGNTIYLILENEKGRIAVKANEKIISNVSSYLNAQKIKMIKPY